MDGRPAALSAQTGCVAASLGGAAPPVLTVDMVVKADVVVQTRLRVLMAAEVTSLSSSALPRSIKCLSIVTTRDVLAMDSIAMMLFSLLLDPLVGLLRREMMPLVRENWRLSLAKLLMKLRVC